MNKLNPISLAGLLLMATTTSNVLADDAVTAAVETVVAEVAGCDTPATPIVPDGNVASEDELVAASKAIKGYQASLIDYRECLQKADAAVAERETEDGMKQIQNVLDTYNASVESEEGLAAEFNTAVKAFKARTAE